MKPLRILFPLKNEYSASVTANSLKGAMGKPPHLFLCSVVEYEQSDEFAPCMNEQGPYASEGVFAAVLARAEQPFAVGLTMESAVTP